MSKSPPLVSASDLEAAVRERYADAARARETALCCPTSYDARLLEALPDEVIERDYGCGDPSRYVRAGETVLDLGSGTGKVCFIAAQVVGPHGRVIGVDMNDEMLALARRAAPEVASRIGFSNVEFRKGKIQDLALDRDAVDAWLREHPVRSEADLVAFEMTLAELRRTRPLVADGTIDVVVSNCVLNLVTPEDKGAMFRELHRVLKRGGRVVISDIVSDEDIPEAMRRDPELWSGCISGAFREDLLLEAFEQAGFYGIEVLVREDEPWRTVDGIEFRSVTVAAYKGKDGPCLDQKHAVIYRGPWRQVQDDDGHVLRRGVRTAVCEKTFGIYARAPYREHVDLVEPRELIPLEQAQPFPCSTMPILRDPRETKGEDYNATTEAAPVCKPGGCC
ncbi:MAG: methyltransferase domain-containing protein [Myxococcota bacterium]|nr:methyltransferase domain-containing protein [Deltaproteobacteria bacterium]MDQ3335716.1 methyltransferase domain-containing protein [Myxococcota bacterium]